MDIFKHMLDISKDILGEIFIFRYKKKSLATDSKILGRIKVIALNMGLPDKQILQMSPTLAGGSREQQWASISHKEHFGLDSSSSLEPLHVL